MASRAFSGHGFGGSSWSCRSGLARLVAVALLGLSVVARGAAPASEPAETIRVQLTARHSAVLSAEIGAKVSRFHVPEGGTFETGDALVSFESSLQMAQVQRARAVLTAAEKTATANRRLLALHSIGEVEAELSESEVAKAKAELSYAEAMLAKCEIKAPFSGRVAEQKVHEQEFVQPGQPLLEILDNAVPQIDFIAPSKWLAWLKAGQRLEVRIDDTGKTYAAVIERIGAKADPVSQSVKVVAALEEKHPELIPGMSGTIVILPEGK
jgi:membrane fusion protein, multidrug efflux system